MKKLEKQKVNAPDQSNNVLIVPPQHAGMTQDDIVELLRMKKNKEEKAKKKAPKKE